MWDLIVSVPDHCLSVLIEFNDPLNITVPLPSNHNYKQTD